ncbi:hypothetical protein CC78DRAFT_53242 [Lojkania enalia]|uniref:Carrier domain-containing protein n=1 Tax=Lojkania enalia TaxID=147567 RepID=A0A9P4K1H8_9PLEO|nr:hypothetical protein CC78DRAFT_53242 [Didymosphaeria enalia]
MLGSLYENAWELNSRRRSQSHFQPLLPPWNPSSSHISSRQFWNMHLPHNETSGFGGESVDLHPTKREADTITPENSKREHTYLSGALNRVNKTLNEVSIPILHHQSLESIIERVAAGWILLLQRYQRDACHQFTWGYNGAGDTSSTVSITQLGLDTAITVKDVIDILHRSETYKLFSYQDRNPVLFFNDGTPEEWTYHISLEFQPQRMRATSQWRPPTMSEHQAIAQLHSFSSILKSMFRDSSQTIVHILDITQDELNQLWQWNTPVPPSLDKCMHDIIWEQAQLQPDKVAIDAWDGRLTYAEIDQFSTDLARNLALLYNTPQPIIPLLFEKSRWTIIAVLAVMKSGAAFALLDPAQPEGRLNTIVEQTNASLILSSKTQAARGAEIFPSAAIIPISESKFSKIYRPFAVQQPNTSLPTVSPSSPLYIQFTSGSTGKPKGVVISHSQYTSGAIPRAYAIGYRSHSRVLDFASYAFDVSVDSMLCTVANGGTLCVPSEERRINDLEGMIRDLKVNLAGLTPSVVRVLSSETLSSLEIVACGGESPSSRDVASWNQKTRVVNAYGPSECTVGATINNEVGGYPYTTIGKGTGCSTWIVDPADHNKLVPPGAVGELMIEGPIVGVGYLNNPTKTEEVYINNPAFLIAGSSQTPGRKGRMYKTGDLVRYDPDGRGEIIFIGRGDQQVKLRGQRVELAEIEFNMLKHLPPGTEAAAEVIKPYGTGDPTLVAFIAEAKDNGIKHLDGDIFSSFTNKFQRSLSGMNKHLAADLPVYMIPSAYISLWKMPRLVSCKTDRKRLREIGSALSRQELRKFAAVISGKQAATTEMERQLQPLWGKVLGLEADFGANENFFRVGGDSLRAMRLVAAAREEGILLTVSNVMLHPELSAMAKKASPMADNAQAEIPPYSMIEKNWKTEDAIVEAAALCGLNVSSIEDIYPCTPLQEGLMALSAKFADAYVAQRVVELSTIEEAERLHRAFEVIIAATPIFRTRIVNVSGRGLYQVVVKDNIAARSATDLAADLQQDRDDPMELGKPLFRYSIIIPPGSSKAHFAISLHHAVYDGWSFPLFVERVNQAYCSMKASPRTPFKQFIKYITSSDRFESETFWRKQLGGANKYQFPPLPQPGYITRADSLLEHYVTVPSSTKSKHTLATIIRGAWALLASSYLGSSDTVFGETLTGRSAPVPGIEQIEGPMITTIPFRVRINENISISQFLDILHEQTVQQMPHEHLGLQHIRRLGLDARQACDLRTGLVLHPKEDGQAVYEDTPDKPANGFVPSDDEEAAREALKFNTYALMLVCTLDSNGFLIMASFDSKTIAVPPMERVLKVFDKVVTVFYETPEKRLGDVRPLGEVELADAKKLRPQETQNNDVTLIQVNALENNDAHPEATVLSGKEEKLRGLLSRILNVPENDINPGDSFFELGGDSIGAMRLVSEAKSLGLKLTVAQIFQSRSLSALAALIGDEKEEKLRTLLSRILSLPKDKIASSDSFFNLGGDSIGAMRLVSEARSQGLKLTVAHVFQSKSLSDLAARAENVATTKMDLAPFGALGNEKDLHTPEAIQPLLVNQTWKIADIYPTRPLQELAVNGTVYLPRYSVRYELIQFPDPINNARLLQACQELVNRNEVLRTIFVKHHGHCLGVVLESLQAPSETILSPEGTELMGFANDYINKDIELPKPYGSSFVSFTLLNSSTGASCLVFRISHAQYDEICLPLVFEQLSALYTGTAVPESEPFSKHVNHVVQSNLPVSIPYWKGLLSGSHMSIFKPSIPITSRKSSYIYRDFDISSRPKDLTIASLPTAAWAIVLANRLGVLDVLFGEVVSGRNIDCPGADKIIGPTWQYIPVRITFQPSWTHLDLLRYVQNQHIESAAYEGMGLSEIVRECTDWDEKEVTWFDSVVHQAPQWVESMEFGGTKAKFDTIYPHEEPLREWKCQAFVMEGGRIRIEIVTFEEWMGVAREVLDEVGDALKRLVGQTNELVFGNEIAVNAGTMDNGLAEGDVNGVEAA